MRWPKPHGIRRGRPRLAQSGTRGLRRDAGFTLIELLLALSIFTILASGLYGVLRTGVEAQRIGEDLTRTTQIARVSLDRIARGLRAAFTSLGPYGSGSVLDGGFFVGTDESSAAGDVDSLVFLTASHFPQQSSSNEEEDGDWVGGECDLMEIKLRIEQDPSSELSGLVESRKHVVQLESDQNAPTEVEIAPEVVSLNLRYHDGSDWADSWDSSEKEVLPRAVEVTIGIAPGKDSRDEEPKLFSIVAGLPMAQAVTAADRADAAAE